MISQPALPLPSPTLPARDNPQETLILSLPGCNIAFNLTQGGHFSSRQLLTPERGIQLVQAPFVTDRFEQAYQGLSTGELRAIEQWKTATGHTGIQGNYPAPEPGQWRLAPPGSPVHASYPAPEAWVAMRDLSSALRRLPSLPGEYLRVEEYPDPASVPWGRRLLPGDIVTAFPDSLSASSTDSHAQWAVNEYARQVHPHALVFYKIVTTSCATPLVPPASFGPDSAFFVLFPRQARFQVKEITVAETPAPVHPSMRVGVLLEMLPGDRPPRSRAAGLPPVPVAGFRQY